MGRPMNKKYMGDVAGNIKVSDYFRVGGSETAGQDDTYIVSQRSNNKFLIADTSGNWSEVLTLVDKNAGSLAEGEFRISAQDADGNTLNSIRLNNRTVRVSGPKNLKWNITAPADLVITNVSIALPAVVTVASTTSLSVNDTITINGIVGTVGTDATNGLNGNNYTVTVLNSTTFELDGSDTSGLTYTSGGVVSGVGNTSSLDVQAT